MTAFKPDFQHLALFLLVVLGLVAHVVLVVLHLPVPDDLTTVVVAGVGALFGITLPGARTGAGDVQP